MTSSFVTFMVGFISGCLTIIGGGIYILYKLSKEEPDDSE